MDYNGNFSLRSFRKLCSRRKSVFNVSERLFRMLLGCCCCCCWVAAAAADTHCYAYSWAPPESTLGGNWSTCATTQREREREREREGGEVKIFLAEILFYFLPLLFCFLASFCSSSRTGRQNGRGRKCNLVIFPLDYVEAH